MWNKPMETDISVNKYPYFNGVLIYIKSNIDFFKDGVIINDDGECLYFTKPSLDYRGHIHNPKINKSGSMQFSAKSDIPVGYYNFDDGDNEDELTIYYKDH